jgi:hypothetical protein
MSAVMSGGLARGAGVALTALLCARAAHAGDGDVEIAPFAGIQFPGSVDSAATGRQYSLGIGLDYGAAADFRVAEGWRVEVMYSRQHTGLSSTAAPDRYNLKIERYMAGIQEEQGHEKARFFGVALLGATRFAPGLDGYGSDVRFTAALGLGLKSYLTPWFGLRAEARGFFVNVDSGGGFVCSGGCLFVFHASGLWQGDITGGVTLAF